MEVLKRLINRIDNCINIAHRRNSRTAVREVGLIYKILSERWRQKNRALCSTRVLPRCPHRSQTLRKNRCIQGHVTPRFEFPATRQFNMATDALCLPTLSGIYAKGFSSRRNCLFIVNILNISVLGFELGCHPHALQGS